MKIIKIFLLIIALALLAGCGAKTTGKDITTKNEFNFGDVYAPVTISPNLSTQSGDTEQDVTAPTEVTTDGELILTPSAQLDKAAAELANAKILAKASELNAKKLGEQLGEAEEDLEEVESDLESLTYQTRFHHTMTDPFDPPKADGGKSLVLCPGQTMNFKKCSVGKIDIPRHDEAEGGREGYWNMTEAPAEDIICEKAGKSYRYPANKMMVNGNCE